jgi:hypothetical protein
MALAPGMQIGKYVLRRKLGAGGYALVFAAHDPSLDREVALKVLKPEHASSEGVVRRFLQEARAAVRIVHPGIVTVFECGEICSPDREEDFTAYIAMELLDGETLSDRIARCGRLAPAVVIEIGRQLAAALEAAHRAGIIHRDLKPGNVFLIEDSLVAGGERAKVLDFGIAKLGRTVAAPGMQTGSLTVLGTWRYMSPEQCRSAANIDHRTDIYALGAMLFELLAGRPPFDGHAVELIAQHLMIQPPPLLALAPETPPALAALIEQLMEKEPAARPASMEAVEHALEAIAMTEGLAPVRPSSMPGLMVVRPRTAPGGAPSESATTIPAATREAEPRAGRGRRRGGVWAGAAIFALASALGAIIALRGPGEVAAADALGQGAERPPVVQPAAATATVTAPAEAAAAAPAAAPDPAIEIEEPAAAPEEPPAARTRSAAARARPAARGKAAAAAPFGYLALTAKPACAILVDGRDLGARTPIRELKLPAGKHRITLRSDEHGIQDSFAVVIGSGATERVSKDYSGQLKRERRDDHGDRGDRGDRDDRNGTINPFATGGG